MTKLDDIFVDVSGRCAALRTLSAARAITRHYDNALRPVGLTITQFTLLITIGYAKPDSITKIGDWLNIERTSLTRNLKPLETAGYITRGKEGPRRKRPIELTATGKKTLNKAYPLWKTAQENVESSLLQDEYDVTMTALDTLMFNSK